MRNDGIIKEKTLKDAHIALTYQCQHEGEATITTITFICFGQKFKDNIRSQAVAESDLSLSLSPLRSDQPYHRAEA